MNGTLSTFICKHYNRKTKRHTIFNSLPGVVFALFPNSLTRSIRRIAASWITTFGGNSLQQPVIQFMVQWERTWESLWPIVTFFRALISQKKWMVIAWGNLKLKWEQPIA